MLISSWYTIRAALFIKNIIYVGIDEKKVYIKCTHDIIRKKKIHRFWDFCENYWNLTFHTFILLSNFHTCKYFS